MQTFSWYPPSDNQILCFLANFWYSGTVTPSQASANEKVLLLSPTKSKHSGKKTI